MIKNKQQLVNSSENLQIYTSYLLFVFFVCLCLLLVLLLLLVLPVGLCLLLVLLVGHCIPLSSLIELSAVSSPCPQCMSVSSPSPIFLSVSWPCSPYIFCLCLLLVLPFCHVFCSFGIWTAKMDMGISGLIVAKQCQCVSTFQNIEEKISWCHGFAVLNFQILGWPLENISIILNEVWYMICS